MKTIHIGEGSGRGSGRVRLFVGNRGSGRVNVSPGRVGSKKSDPWTTLVFIIHFSTMVYLIYAAHDDIVYNLQLDMFRMFLTDFT